MLDRRIRKLIEWHFKNYKADSHLHADRELDIIEGRMAVPESYINSRFRKSTPTETKAIKIIDLNERQDWFGVVQNTFTAFHFGPEYKIMVALYIEHKPWQSIISAGIPERTFFYWRDRWLEYAYQWAQEYKLM